MNPLLLSILLLVGFSLLVILLGFFGIGGLSLAPWVPLYPSDHKRVMDILNLKSGDILYELGSGTGIVTTNAGLIYGVTATGIEISPVLFCYSVLKKYIKQSHGARFWLKNLYTTNLSDATVIYIYGMPNKNGKVVAKLQKECKPGTRIISYTFHMPGLQHTVRHRDTDTQVPIYEYIIQ